MTPSEGRGAKEASKQVSQERSQAEAGRCREQHDRTCVRFGSGQRELCAECRPCRFGQVKSQLDAPRPVDLCDARVLIHVAHGVVARIVTTPDDSAANRSELLAAQGADDPLVEAQFQRRVAPCVRLSFGGIV